MIKQAKQSKDCHAKLKCLKQGCTGAAMIDWLH